MDLSESKYSMEEIIKILTIIFLSSFSVWLISYYILVIKEEMFYTHFIYIPGVLSSFWWGKKGSINAIFLGFFLLLSDILADVGSEKIAQHLSQIFIFLIVALLTGVVSDERTQALKEKEKFLEDAAHYFLNPVTIAKGYVDMMFEECESEKLKGIANRIKEAVERIEEVVKNTVEKGIIYEGKGDVDKLKQSREKT